jgi:hypothetical protein
MMDLTATCVSDPATRGPCKQSMTRAVELQPSTAHTRHTCSMHLFGRTTRSPHGRSRTTQKQTRRQHGRDRQLAHLVPSAVGFTRCNYSHKEEILIVGLTYKSSIDVLKHVNETKIASHKTLLTFHHREESSQQHKRRARVAQLHIAPRIVRRTHSLAGHGPESARASCVATRCIHRPLPSEAVRALPSVDVHR